MWRINWQPLLVLLCCWCFGPRVTFSLKTTQSISIRSDGSSRLLQTEQDDPSRRPDYYDKLRNRTDLTAESNSTSKIYRVTVNSTDANDNNTTTKATYRLADLKTFMPFSNGKVTRQGFQDDAFTALLAAYHFNNPDLSPILTQEQVAGCDVRLTMELLDTQYSPIETTRAFTNVLQRQTGFAVPEAAGVVGAYRSAVTSPLAILTGVNDIPQITSASTAVDFDVKEQYPLFGRTVTSTVGEAEVALKFFQSVNASHVAVIFVTDSYGSALQKAFQDAATKKNVTTDSIAFTYNIQPGREVDSIVKAMEKNQFRHVFAILNDNHAVSIMTALANNSMVGPDYLYILPGIDVFALQADFGLETMKAGSLLAKAYDGLGIIQMAGGVMTEPIINGEAAVSPPDESATTGFEKFRLSWAEALQDPEFSEYVRLRLPDSLSVLSSFDRIATFANDPGAFRPFLYDAVTSFGLSMCQAGQNSTFFTGPGIYNEFRQLDFEGASGRVMIDSSTGTRNYSSIAFVLWNLQIYGKDEDGFAQFKLVPSRKFEDNGWVEIPGNPFIFPNGTETAPASLPEVAFNFNYIGKKARASGYALMAFAMASSILSLLWLVYYRDEPVVNSSQPLCLTMVSAGAFIMASTIIPLSLEETIVDSTGLDKACMAAPWLYVLGTCVALSALLAKTRGVYKAYKNPELDFIHVSPVDILGTFAWMVSINLILMITWTLVSPLEWSRVKGEERDVFERLFQSYGTCESDDSVLFVVLIIVTNVIFLILGNWWNYISRNIETEYGESRYIGISMAATLQAWGMGIPILVVVWDNPQARFFVESGIIFVTSLAFLATVYLPKVLALRADRAKTNDGKTEAFSNYQARAKQPNDYEDEEEEEDQYDDMLPMTVQDASAAEEAKVEHSGEDKNPQDALPDHRGNRGSIFGGRATPSSYTSGSVGAIKVLHNPRTSANLLISGGRELSREQFSHFRESLVSKVEDDGNQEAVSEDEDGKMEGAAGNSRNADGPGAVISEDISSSPGHIDDPLEGSSSLGSGRNHTKVKRGIRDSIFGRRAKASKSMVDQGEGGIKVLHNPRTPTNLMMTGGRELSRQQLSHFNESLFSRVEDETIRNPNVSTLTLTGEASQEPSHTPSPEPSHADDASLFTTVEDETTRIPDVDTKREASQEQSHADDAPDR